jgi:hypothetical protein
MGSGDLSPAGPGQSPGLASLAAAQCPGRIGRAPKGEDHRGGPSLKADGNILALWWLCAAVPARRRGRFTGSGRGYWDALGPIVVSALKRIAR